MPTLAQEKRRLDRIDLERILATITLAEGNQVGEFTQLLTEIDEHRRDITVHWDHQSQMHYIEI